MQRHQMQRPVRRVCQISLTTHARSLCLVFLFALVELQPLAKAESVRSQRTVLSADRDWQFFLGDPAGAEAPGFDDHNWRTVSAPHDWSVESPAEKTNPTGQSGGYSLAGIGWYRKSFSAPAVWRDKRVEIEFDGVAANATVFLNGKKLGFHPYAYTTFRYDLTDALRASSPNVLAIRVDNSQQPASRWYVGAGLYRHVRVIVTGPVHVAPWGVFVSTQSAAAADAATIAVKTTVQNEAATSDQLTVRSVITLQGATAARLDTTALIDARASQTLQQTIPLRQPKVWSPATPVLYQLRTQILRRGEIVDETTTSFGIRTISWSVNKGLLINGASLKLLGGSVHHDNGPLGAAAYDRAEQRKVELLKQAGAGPARFCPHLELPRA